MHSTGLITKTKHPYQYNGWNINLHSSILGCSGSFGPIIVCWRSYIDSQKIGTYHYREIQLPHSRNHWGFFPPLWPEEPQFQRNSKLSFLNVFLQTSAIWGCVVCQVRLLRNLRWGFLEFFKILVWGLFPKNPDMAQYMYDEIIKRMFITFSGAKCSTPNIVFW